MSSLPYANVPHCATRIQEDNALVKPTLVTSNIPTEAASEFASSPAAATSPTKQPFNLPHILLSSSLLPNTLPISPRDGALLSSLRDLSLQTMTVNFRRFVSKSGPLFWLQDRVEEIVMWRKGWRVTCTWMAMYTFLCYFPRMFLLLPHIVVISLLLATHTAPLPGKCESLQQEEPAPLPAQQPKEGTVDWYANMQAIQNLMGYVSDLYDAALPLLPTLTWAAAHTPQLLTLSCLSLFLLIPVAIAIPLRPIFLFIGLAPFFITHPLVLRTLPTLLRPLIRKLQSRAQRLIDNDNLIERHWYADIREVELWENERWTAGVGWSKSSLKAGERKPWTRGRDGWSDIISGGDVSSSSLTFTLSPSYEFVETEDWRVDLEGTWGLSGGDSHGWVYTNDSWLDPRPTPLEEWKGQGLTRRRRWTRRIYMIDKP